MPNKNGYDWQMKFRWQFSTMTKKTLHLLLLYNDTDWLSRNEIWIFENFQLLIILLALKPINKNEMYNRESHGESKELDNGWFRPHFYAGLLLVFSQIRFLFYNFGICSFHFAVCWVCSTIWHNKQSNKNELKILLCKQIVVLPKNVLYQNTMLLNCNWNTKCKKNYFQYFFYI